MVARTLTTSRLLRVRGHASGGRAPNTRAMSPSILHILGAHFCPSIRLPTVPLPLQTRHTSRSAYSKYHPFLDSTYPMEQRVPRFYSWVSTYYTHSERARKTHNPAQLDTTPLSYFALLPCALRHSMRSHPTRLRPSHGPVLSRAPRRYHTACLSTSRSSRRVACCWTRRRAARCRDARSSSCGVRIHCGKWPVLLGQSRSCTRNAKQWGRPGVYWRWWRCLVRTTSVRSFHSTGGVCVSSAADRDTCSHIGLTPTQ